MKPAPPVTKIVIFFSIFCPIRFSREMSSLFSCKFPKSCKHPDKNPEIRCQFPINHHEELHLPDIVQPLSQHSNPTPCKFFSKTHFFYYLKKNIQKSIFYYSQLIITYYIHEKQTITNYVKANISIIIKKKLMKFNGPILNDYQNY